jgi:stress-induced morphogen
MGKYKFYIVGPVLLVGGAKRNQNWRKLLELLVEKKFSEQKFVEYNKKSLVTLFKLEGRKEGERRDQTIEILEVSSHFDQKKEYQRHRRIDQVIKNLKS